MKGGLERAGTGLGAVLGRFRAFWRVLGACPGSSAARWGAGVGFGVGFGVFWPNALGLPRALCEQTDPTGAVWGPRGAGCADRASFGVTPGWFGAKPRTPSPFPPQTPSNPPQSRTQSPAEPGAVTPQRGPLGVSMGRGSCSPRPRCGSSPRSLPGISRLSSPQWHRAQQRGWEQHPASSPSSSSSPTQLPGAQVAGMLRDPPSLGER